MIPENSGNEQNVIPTFRYHAYGLEIESQLLLPELLPGNNQQKPGIYIRLSKVPEKLTDAIFCGVRFQASPNSFLLQVDRVARYLIRDGKYIDIEPFENAKEGDIRLFLLGSAIGALFHQQGLLPFHGSAIVYNNKAIIFSGVSGAGKSTLAAAFHQMGYPVLTDDICMIALSETKTPVVYSSYPQMKLWADSLEKLGEDKSPLKKVREGIHKFSMPLPTNFHRKSVELAGIYIVSSKNTPGITLEIVKGIEKFNILKNNTYRLNFIKGTGTTTAHFTHIEAISRLCFVRKIERPSKGFHLSDLTKVIEEDFMKMII